MHEAPTIAKILNNADPTIVPDPIDSAPPLASAAIAVNNSGALDPIAMSVAPATFGDKCSLLLAISKLSTK